MTTDVIVLAQPEQVVVNTQDKVTVIDSAFEPVVISQLAEGPQGPPGPRDRLTIPRSIHVQTCGLYPLGT